MQCHRANEFTMKKYLTAIAMVILVSAGSFLTSCSARVTTRPAATVVAVRPAMPAPGYVWIREDWHRHHGRYVNRGGYWAMPPAHGHHWVDGYWQYNRQSRVWVPGYWR